jgi:hypothetical protein
MQDILIEISSWVLLALGIIGIFLMAVFDKGGKP